MGDLIMKKTVLFAFAAAAAAFVVASCDKTSLVETPVTPEQEVTDPKTPEDPADGVPEGMVRLTFGVTAEGEGTKTQWNGTAHSWSDGDQIRIIWGAGDSDYVDAAVVDGKVTATVGQADNYYAVYPTTAAYALDASAGTLTITIPRYQTGKFEDADIMAAKTPAATPALNFKGVTHIFKIHLTDASTFNRLEFQSLLPNKLLVDPMLVSFDGSGNVTVESQSAVVDGSHSKYVDLQNNITAGNDYYFAVVPGSDLSKGIIIKARDTQTGSFNVFGFGKSSIDAKRGVITNLGDLDKRIHADWFIKPEGTGDGSSWDNAGGLDLFVKLVGTPTTEDSGVASTMRLNNAKIHFMEGTYNIEEAYGEQKQFQAGTFSSEVDNVTLIEGGYPSSATGTDLSGYNPSSYVTRFISNQSENNDRVFYFNGARLYDWTFKGLSFENNTAGTNFNTPGGAVAINGGTNGNIKFEDCSFILTTSNSSGGGALSFRGTAEVNAEFKNCTFSGCSSTSGFGGAIWINTEKHNLTFNGCTFTGNTAAKGGGFLYNQNSGTVIIKNSFFENNVATSSNGLGGAIYASGSGNIEIDCCILKGNGTDAQAQHGGVIWMGGTTSLSIGNGTAVTNNKASSRGGVILVAENSALNADGVSFSGNNALNGGVIHVNGGTAYVNTCEFKDNSATNGAALRAAGTADNQANLIVNACLFDSNTPSGSANGGGCINANTYSRTIVSNSTIRNTSGGNGAAMSIDGGAAGTYGYMYAVSCTFSGNTIDFGRNYNFFYFHNCIADHNVTVANPGKSYSILGDNRYSTNKTIVETETGLGAACLGSFSGGVYPLNSAKEASYGAGMSADDLQALTFNNITLTDEQKALLAKDQKGKDRTGTIMGAFVGN